ncbi:MAG TPA: hypothetical protein VK161_09355 [Flavobacterium sp.]|nr:hypothetical protein [Flavobacterium sp.]
MKNLKLIEVKTMLVKVMVSFLFLVLNSCANDKTTNFNKRINAVKIAIEQKSIDSLQPYLANGYTIKGLPEGMESIILPMILNKLPAQKRFTIDSQKEEKRGTRLHVTFFDANNKAIKSNFLIAKDGKFLELNILEDAKISTSISE